jgi:hypothetical protein
LPEVTTLIVQRPGRRRNEIGEAVPKVTLVVDLGFRQREAG